MINPKSFCGILFLVIIGLSLCGCKQISSFVENNSSVKNNSLQEPPAIFDVKINSLTCVWSVKTDNYGNKNDCIRIVSKGTA